MFDKMDFAVLAASSLMRTMFFHHC